MKRTFLSRNVLNGCMIALLATTAVTSTGFLSPASADPYNARARCHSHHRNHQYYNYSGYDYRRPTYFERHPYQKSGLIGAGVGAAAGALLGNEYDRGGSAVKGAVLGGAAGLGYRYLKNNDMFHL